MKISDTIISLIPKPLAPKYPTKILEVEIPPSKIQTSFIHDPYARSLLFYNYTLVSLSYVIV